MQFNSKQVHTLNFIVSVTIHRTNVVVVVVDVIISYLSWSGLESSQYADILIFRNRKMHRYNHLIQRFVAKRVSFVYKSK